MAETLRDFSGTLASFVDMEDPDMFKAVKAWDITIKVVSEYCIGSMIVKDSTPKEIRNAALYISSNILYDIFKTGMYPETKEFMEHVLSGGKDITSEKVKRFCSDYFGGIASECCVSEDDINRVASEMMCD
jgi:hypothetical protein